MAGLLIVGAGGHGKVVADTAYESRRWDRIAFLDDRYPEITSLLSWPVLGKIEQASSFLSEYSEAIIAIGNNLLRVDLVQFFIEMGFSVPCLVHPNAYISNFALLGAGSVLFSQAAVNAGSQIGRGAIINTGATIDHDCFIGEGVHISPGAHLAGAVKVGKYSWLGCGSTVIQQTCIGENVVVGAGAVIIKNIPNDVTVVGVPGRIINSRSRL